MFFSVKFPFEPDAGDPSVCNDVRLGQRDAGIGAEELLVVLESHCEFLLRSEAYTMRVRVRGYRISQECAEGSPSCPLP